MSQQALQQTIPANEWEIIREQATILIKSKFLPQSIQTPEQALAIILTGREIGIPTMAALNTINVIQGKPTVSPQLMLALINRSGQLEDMQLETGKDGATCTLKRKGRAPYTAHFGPNEAKAMKLDEKDNYKKQGPVMYQWRAVAQAARVVFADVILGLYTPEEMGADVVVRENGEMFVQPVADHAESAPQQPLQLASAPPKSADEDKAALLRDKRGQGLAAMGLVKRDGDKFIVKTATIKGKSEQFEVSRDASGKVLCTCPTFVSNIKSDAAYRCEHILAVKHSLLAKNSEAVTKAQPQLPAVEAPAEVSEVERERVRLRAIVQAEFDRLGYDDKDISEYLSKNSNGVPLTEMSLDQLLQICDMQELDTSPLAGVEAAF